MKKIIWLLILGSSLTAYSQTTLPSFFSDNMVLQQNDDVAIWGTDEPDSKITVTTGWGEKARAETAPDGKWKVKIATPHAGGPYTVTIKGSEEVELKNILIGEVWLCSGQSNMDMPLKGFLNQPVSGSNEAILHSKNNNLRVFKAERNASLGPLDNVKGKWLSSDPSTAGDFSATAYFFGKLLQEVLDVPVGLVTTSWGGSSIEAWMSRETLSEFKNIPLPSRFPNKLPNKTPTLLYNAMLNPFVGFNIKGVLWYQGEANRNRPEEYKELFPAMIKSWRADWKQQDLPFYFVQIAPFNYNGGNSAGLREAQLHTMQNVENTGMAVTLDIGDCGNIHPADKKPVGDRLAYWALAKTYGIKGIEYSGPVYKSYEVIENGRINISFAHVSNGLSGFNNELTGFTIAGEDRIFYPATAKINRNKTVTVWSKDVKKPVSVRYGYDNCVTGTLFNTAGLPASSFRTDDWKDRDEQVIIK